jgi:DNA polymerase-3 subunit gamma/tau
MDNSYLVIARRYRPQLFADVVGQEAVVRTLQNAFRSGRVCHAYLFSGSRGTGKTSIARLYAKLLNCASPSPSGEPCNSCPSCLEIAEGRSLDVQEIDGASNRGIDHIRSLTDSVSYAPACGRYKIYLIDEVHMLTKEAFNALLKTLEEPPKTVIFFLATTEPHKIPATIISRCQRFNLKRLPKEAIVNKLKRIVHDMSVRADDSALFRLAGYADGGLRDAESLLDQAVTFSDGHLREEIINEVLGIAPMEWFLELDRAIDTADISVAYTLSDRVFLEGKDIGHFIDDLTDHYRTLLLLQQNIPLHGLQVDSAHEGALRATAASLPVEHLLDLLSILAEAQKTLKTAASQRFLLEWLLLNIVRIRRKVPLSLIARRLFELQERLGSAADDPPTGEESRSAAKPPHVNQRPKERAPCQPEACQTRAEPPVPQEKPLLSPIADVSEETCPTIPNATAEAAAALPRPSLPALTPEQEKARQENLVQFAASELRATITKS